MNRPKIRNYKEGSEVKIQEALIKFLRERGWFVKIMHGSTYQHGVPDLYIAKRSWGGGRWVEVKNPEKWSFTAAQWETFPRLIAEGVGIWVLTAATEEEYAKLRGKPNLWKFMGGYV